MGVGPQRPGGAKLHPCRFHPYHPWMRWVPLAVLLVLSARLAPAQAPEPAAPVHLVIVGTTDVHGHVEERVDPVEKPGSGTIRHGGLAAFAGELANLRASEPGRVVWLDSGDEFQGTLLSNVSEGGRS